MLTVQYWLRNVYRKIDSLFDLSLPKLDTLEVVQPRNYKPLLTR
jgi:hypothetical protein